MTENSSGEPSGKSPDKPSADPDQIYLSRRRFLKGIGALATSALVLGGCEPGQTPETPAPSGPPPEPGVPPAEAPAPAERAIPPELASSGQETINAQIILSPQSEAPQELKENRLKTRSDGSENPPNFLTDHGFQTEPDNIHSFTIYWPRLSCYIARYGLPQDGEITAALNDRGRYVHEYLAFCEAIAFYRTLISEGFIGSNETMRNVTLFVFADDDPRTTNFPLRRWGGMVSKFGPVVKFSFVDGRIGVIEELSHDLIDNEPGAFAGIEVPYDDRTLIVDGSQGWTFGYTDPHFGERQNSEDGIINPETGTVDSQKSIWETINRRMYQHIAQRMTGRYGVQFADYADARELGTVTSVFVSLNVTAEDLIRISLRYRKNAILSLAQFLGGKCEDRGFSTQNLTADDQGRARMIKGLTLIRAIGHNNQPVISACFQ